MTQELEKMECEVNAREMDFLRKMGVDVLGNYNEVARHMDRMFEAFREREKEHVEREMDYRDYMDKVDALHAIGDELAELKRIVHMMPNSKKSPFKGRLFEVIERMEIDVC